MSKKMIKILKEEPRTQEMRTCESSNLWKYQEDDHIAKGVEVAPAAGPSYT
jgi:hypothetical protein